jgi:hypothetical protein
MQKLTQNELDISVRAKTIKLLEEKLEVNIHNFEPGRVLGYDTKSTSNKRKQKKQGTGGSHL